MSKLNELNSYIAQVQRRLRLGAWIQGGAVFTGTALLITVVLVLALNYFAFPHRGMISARIALLVVLAAAAAFGMILPVRRLSIARAVSRLEAVNPELEQRLTTFHQAERNTEGPFLELLAADTLQRTQYAPPATLVPNNRIFALCGATFACVATLVWMIAAGPGYIGYGASLLWTGAKKNAEPFYSISVAPGNVLVRRNSDQLISVRITGMRPSQVQLFAHYRSAKGWEAAAMQMRPQANGDANYEFVLAGLPEDVDYYAAAGPLASPHYTVRVVDLPSVKRIRVSYRYPAWTGMKPSTEEQSGDLRAIEGTNAEVEIEMDRPLKGGQLLLDAGQSIPLSSGQGNRYRGTIYMDKDGAYHVAALDSGQPVRLSEDYFIATDKAQPPEVSINRPHGDYRAIPIEEVTVGVDAADQFALRDMQLHYSVNGGAERVVNLLNSPGAKQSQGLHTLPLEDFKLVPGDLVSLYATARDGHAEARTDISFIQVEPFEREFSQSQQSGGNGGGSGGGENNQTEISKREKELIAATWKQLNDKTATAKDAAVQGLFLSDAQQKLRDQVQALSARIESRDLSAATEEFSSFDRDMQMAAEAMAPSAQKLQATRWADALPLEQKALQALLRAEATFRKIEVAFGQSGGGSGGGGNAGRDLASLFDLELDTEKNQYETGQTASPAQQHEKEIEDALAKLDALARRQQEQAQQQPNPQQAFEQRWQQEMLRREAEELQRQMEQLAKNGQQQGSQNANSAASPNSRQSNPASHQSSSSSNGSQSGQPDTNQTDARVQQALRRLQDAAEAMKRSSGPQQNRDAARQAADQLRQAANLLAGSHQQLATSKLDSLAGAAAKLRDEERSQAQQIDKLAAQPSDGNPTDLSGTMDRLHARDRLAQQRQQLSDDLSQLSRDMREGALAMAPHEHDAAKQLRDALTEMDNSDLDNRVQRSADWLRRGINPNSNGTEEQIAQGLSKLQQQLEKARETAGKAQPEQDSSPSRGEAATLNAIERLRRQVESLSRANQGQKSGQSGERGQPSGAEQARNGKSQAGAAQGPSNAAGNQASGRSTASGNSSRDLSRGGSPAAGDLGGQRGGTRNDGANDADSTVWGNINTGNNTYGPPGQRSVPGSSSDNPADAERLFQQGMRQLSELRSMVKGDPQASQEAEKLAREMQGLDPRRFPGNPEIVEEMHRELLGAIDRLELEIEHNSGDALQSRTGKSDSVPAGYQDAVAEYFRTLSKTP
jgi:hypothetical protein